ncbi:AH receptor-interacting protein [Contarinia nasturtii]|uniref:AH receptor-interacting protein n=1 Tax=Contarinia nasturtii TaxID=265458 RepID=UPI0012D46587|nr:AH receptor-interacting protein [Contarinia nasturtii]
MDLNTSDEALIKKEIIYRGSKYIPLVDGTKVKFHYQTKTCYDNNDQKIIDDSKKYGKPMELIIGKKFKFEVWEAIVKKMSLNEVAKFRVHKSLVAQYPFISKTLRDIEKPKEERKHCCGMTIQNEGIGYKDLDELFAKQCDLEFIIELISVELPTEYEKESWQLTENERFSTIKENREIGNELYRNGKIAEAEDKYRAALAIIEQLLLKEKPHDTEWMELIKIKIPLLLNYSQCKLLKKDYYAVIEHCTEVLKHEPNNVKALYRRAKGHVGAWNPDDAKKDFQRCLELDTGLTKSINRDLSQLNEDIKLNEVEAKLRYKSLFS